MNPSTILLFTSQIILIALWSVKTHAEDAPLSESSKINDLNNLSLFENVTMNDFSRTSLSENMTINFSSNTPLAGTIGSNIESNKYTTKVTIAAEYDMKSTTRGINETDIQFNSFLNGTDVNSTDELGSALVYTTEAPLTEVTELTTFGGNFSTVLAEENTTALNQTSEDAEIADDKNITMTSEEVDANHVTEGLSTEASTYFEYFNSTEFDFDFNYTTANSSASVLGTRHEVRCNSHHLILLLMVLLPIAVLL